MSGGCLSCGSCSTTRRLAPFEAVSREVTAAGLSAPSFARTADYSALAKSLKAEGLTVNRHCEIEDAISYALTCGRPCVIDMRIARDPVPPPIAGMWFEPERDEIPPRPRH